jgi:MFS family permease
MLSHAEKAKKQLEEINSVQSKVPQLPWVSTRLFYGWIIVAAGVITQFFQGITSQGFTTYLDLLQKDFGWSKAVLAGPRSISSVESSVLGPISGWSVDKFGPRRMVAIGVFIMGSGFILFGSTNSLWMYYLSNIIIALGVAFEGLVIMSVAVNNWFRRRRAIAQSVMFVGYSLAGVIGIPLLVFSQTTLGWRNSAVACGIFIWAVGFPCSLLIRTKPEAHGLLPDGDTTESIARAAAGGETRKEEYNFSLREAVRTRAFWFLAVGWALGSMGMGAAQVHLFLHLEEDVGLSRTTAAVVWTIASIANVPSRLIGGFLGDKVGKNLILGLSGVLMATSMFILGVATGLHMALVFAILYGIGWGIRTPVMSAVQGEYFGRKSMGVIFGWLQSLSLPFTIAAPVVAGYMADVQGSYRLTFIVMSFVMLIGGMVMFLAIPPRPRQYATSQPAH